MSDTLWLAELVLHDGVSATTKYYSNLGFTTGPGETPASTHFAGRLLQPVTAARNIFRIGGATSGAATATEGQLILANGDGALDSLFASCGIDGRALTIRQGVPGAAYPSGFTTVFRGTMQGQAELQADKVILRVRGREEELNIPLQSTFYTGANVLPAGLEGTEELTGKPKPVCYGTVRNIAPICVNTSKLIYQVADKAVASIGPVYDSGVRLGFGFPVQAVSGMTTANSDVIMTDGTTVVGSQADKLYTSTDLVTWTLQFTGAGTLLHGAWCSAISLFVVVEATHVYTSPDGVTWTTYNFATSFLRRVINGTSSVVVIGSNAAGTSPEVYSSTDGITYTSRTHNFTAAVAVAGQGGFGDARFILTGLASAAVGHQECVTSTDNGVTWAQLTIPYTSGATFSKINCDAFWANDIWLVERNNGEIAVSVDAVTWSLHPSGFGPDGTTANIGEFYYFEGRYYAFSQSVTSGVSVPSMYAYSDDGVTWIQKPLGYATGSTVQVVCVIDFDDLIVIAGSHGLAVSEGVTTFASLTDLEDDSLAPTDNTYGILLDASGSYIRLGATPAGQITCNASEGATAADRTIGQIWKRMLQDRGSLVSGTDFSAGDITTLDAALTGETGIWVGTDVVSLSAKLDELTAPECWWLPDRTGIYRLKQLLAPSGTAAATFVASSLKKLLTRRPNTDAGEGLPCWKVIVYYSKNYTVQTSGLAGGVDDATRADLALEWRSVTAEDASVLTQHLLAPTLSFYALVASASDAQNIANRLLALKKVQRDRYPIVVEATAANNLLDNGNVVTIQHARFGLSAGKKFVIVAVAPDAADRSIGLELFGGV